MGIYYQPVTKQLAQERDLPVDTGVVVDASGAQPAVFPDNPAAAAGLKAGDVITEVDGTAVSAESDLAELMLPHQPGDTITLTVLRGSSKQEVQVKLGTLPQQP